MLWVVLVLVLFVAGALLLGLGLRGRVIDDHPLCRRCKFDLVGLVPAAWPASAPLVCPECGRGIQGPGDLRIGTRVRRRGFVVSGTVTLSVLLIGVGSVVWLVVKGSSVYAKLPTPMLRVLIPYRSSGELDAIGKELGIRIGAGEIDSKEAARILDAALDLQADWNRPWSTPIGGAIEAAIVAGQASDAQLDRYIRNAIRLDSRVRSRIAEGGEMPVLAMIRDRTGQGAVLSIQAHLLDVVIDDQRIDGERCSISGAIGYPGGAIASVPGSVPPAMEFLLGEIERHASMGASETPFEPARIRAAPGERTVTMVWALTTGRSAPAPGGPSGCGWCRSHIPPPTGTPPDRTLENIRPRALQLFSSPDHVCNWGPSYGQQSNPNGAPHAHVELIRIKQKVTIVPQGEHSVETTSIGPVIAPGRGVVAGNASWVQPAAPPWHPHARLNISLTANSNVAVAGNVFWLINGEKKPLGSLVLEAPSPGRWAGASVFLPHEPACPEIVELVIEPDPTVAERTIDCSRIVGENVRVSVKVSEEMREKLRGDGK